MLVGWGGVRLRVGMWWRGGGDREAWEWGGERGRNCEGVREERFAYEMRCD